MLLQANAQRIECKHLLFDALCISLSDRWSPCFNCKSIMFSVRCVLCVLWYFLQTIVSAASGSTLLSFIKNIRTNAFSDSDCKLLFLLATLQITCSLRYGNCVSSKEANIQKLVYAFKAGRGVTLE